MSKVLITGAGGTVGRALSPLLSETFETVLTSRATEVLKAVLADLSQPAEVESLLSEVQPDAVVHLAGNKSVFQLEEDKNLSQHENVMTTQNLCKALENTNVHLIFLSSDYVFRGDSGPYSESAVPDPQTVYGQDKLTAEQMVLNSDVNAAVVRTAGVFGYPGDFVELVYRTLSTGESFDAYTDVCNTPTFAGDLAVMLTVILKQKLLGTFHCCGSQHVSRFDFAQIIAEAFGLDQSLLKESVCSDIRPKDVRLDAAASFETLQFMPSPLLETLKSHSKYWQD